jgi:hypothetical protein
VAPSAESRLRLSLRETRQARTVNHPIVLPYTINSRMHDDRSIAETFGACPYARLLRVGSMAADPIMVRPEASTR